MQNEEVLIFQLVNLLQHGGSLKRLQKGMRYWVHLSEIIAVYHTGSAVNPSLTKKVSMFSIGLTLYPLKVD